MIKTLYISGNDFTKHLLKDGLSEINIEVENEDGQSVISSTKARLTNLKHALSSIKNSYRAPVQIKLDGNIAFSGFIDDNGVAYDKDNETIEFEALANDKSFIEQAKALGVAYINGISQCKQMLPIYNNSSGQSTPRYFWNLNKTLNKIFKHFNYNLHIKDDISFVPSNLFFGGVLYYYDKPSLPHITCYDLIKDAAKLLNGIWYTGVDKTLSFIVKRTKIIDNKSIPPITLRRIKHQFIVKYKGSYRDKISFSYSNYQDEYFVGTKLASDYIRNSNTIVNDYDIKSVFAAAFHYNNCAMIPESNFGNKANSIFVVKVLGATPDKQQYLTPAEILNTYYFNEIEATYEFEAEYSLIKDAQQLSRIINPYNPINIPTDSRSFFVRSAQINSNEDKVKINAIGYQL